MTLRHFKPGWGVQGAESYSLLTEAREVEVGREWLEGQSRSCHDAPVRLAWALKRSRGGVRRALKSRVWGSWRVRGVRADRCQGESVFLSEAAPHGQCRFGREGPVWHREKET